MKKWKRKNNFLLPFFPSTWRDFFALKLKNVLIPDSLFLWGKLCAREGPEHDSIKKTFFGYPSTRIVLLAEVSSPSRASFRYHPANVSWYSLVIPIMFVQIRVAKLQVPPYVCRIVFTSTLRELGWQQHCCLCDDSEWRELSDGVGGWKQDLFVNKRSETQSITTKKGKETRNTKKRRGEENSEMEFHRNLLSSQI